MRLIKNQLPVQRLIRGRLLAPKEQSAQQKNRAPARFFIFIVIPKGADPAQSWAEPERRCGFRHCSNSGYGSGAVPGAA